MNSTERKWFLYCITNKNNNKKYIGLTIDFIKRWYKHKNDSITKRKDKYYAFQAALNKYGVENFDWEVIAECKTLDAANEAETILIRQYNSLCPNGYNLSEGGGSHKLHPDSIEKIRAKLKLVGSFVGKKGSDHPNFGTKLSKDRKEHLSNKFSGDSSANKKINSQIAREIYLKFLNDSSIYATDLVKLYPLKKVAILNILNKKCWKAATKDLPDIDMKSRTCGENWAKSKLTENIVREIIIDRLLNNTPYFELSAKYNLTLSTIHNIVTRKSWKHLKL